MVYFLACDNGEMYSSTYTFLDGDISKVGPVGVEYMSSGLAPVDEGWWVQHSPEMQGVKIDPTHLPTKIRWGGRKRTITDMQRVRGTYIVRDNFREVVERLEPGVHDFYPVELFWKDGSSAGQFYWFYPQTRLNGVDRQQTTYPFGAVSYRMGGNKDKTMVFNLGQIGDHHVWLEKFIDINQPYVSEAFKQAMDEAGVTGLAYGERLTTE